MKTLKCFALICCLLPITAKACDIGDIEFLSSSKVKYFDFTQTKTIESLARPLLSSGEIWLSDNKELVWKTTIPFKSTMAISRNGLRQFDKDDQFLSAIALPEVIELTNVFLDIFSGDIEGIEKVFNSDIECSDTHWDLLLTPKDEALSKYILSISLSGNALSQMVRFEELRGDITEILLSEKQGDPGKFRETYLED